MPTYCRSSRPRPSGGASLFIDVSLLLCPASTEGEPLIKTESERQSWNFSTLLWHSAPSSWCWWASSDSASPPKKVAPVALIWTLVLAFTYFNITVAACATVDQIGNENKVMKRTLPAFAIILGVYMVLTMLYTCVLFPHFGME